MIADITALTPEQVMLNFLSIRREIEQKVTFILIIQLVNTIRDQLAFLEKG